MANALAEGTREAGATVDVKRVPEMVSSQVAKASYYKIDRGGRIANIEDIASYDAVVIGDAAAFRG